MINFIDTSIYNLIFKMQSVSTTVFMQFISYLGSATILITITLIILIVSKNKKAASKIAVNLTMVFLLNRLLKLLFRRERPAVLRLAEEKGFSFPSGHAMVAIGFYGYIIYLVYKYVKNKKARNVIIALIGALILLIGISRIYLGVHYATDIIGAYIIGLIYLYVFINNIDKIYMRKNKGTK